MSKTAGNAEKAKTYVIDLDRESRERCGAVWNGHTDGERLDLEHNSADWTPYNPESNPTCPLVLVSVRSTQGAANVL